MSEASLRQMIDYASSFAERAFVKRGQVMPMYHVVTGDGENLVIPMPSNDKNVAVAMMKKLFEVTKAERYIFMDEAWILTGKPGEIDEERAMRKGIHDNPNREEAIVFLAEDRERMLTARRMITRIGEKAELGPLIIDEATSSEGRMIGLLRPAGAMQ